MLDKLEREEQRNRERERGFIIVDQSYRFQIKHTDL